MGGRALLRQMQNGVNLDLRDHATDRYTLFDPLGRPATFPHLDTNQTGDPVVIGFEYDYDLLGSKRNIRSRRSMHDTAESQRYSYDSAGCLAATMRGDFTRGMGFQPMSSGSGFDPMSVFTTPTQQPPSG